MVKNAADNECKSINNPKYILRGTSLIKNEEEESYVKLEKCSPIKIYIKDDTLYKSNLNFYPVSLLQVLQHPYLPV